MPIAPLRVRWHRAWAAMSWLEVCVITVRREPSYVFGTLANLLATNSKLTRIDVFVGSPDESDVESIRSWPQIKIHPMPATLWTRIRDLPGGQRAAANFMHALYSGKGPMLLVEDDIAIATGWRPALDIAMGHDSFVSLFVHPKMAAEIDACEERDGRRHAYYLATAPFELYGTLGLYVPPRERHLLADFINAHLEEGPFDELVQRYCQERGLGIVFPGRSWIDHRGDVSAIVENADHGPRRSPRWYHDDMADSTKPPPNVVIKPARTIEAAAPEPEVLPAIPELPSTVDPACGVAKKHLANCACTGSARGPF